MPDELQKIPSVDSILKHTDIVQRALQWGAPVTTFAVRQVISSARSAAMERGDPVHTESIIRDVCILIERLARPSMTRVINATGIIIHTNLGRAPIGEAILREAFSTLPYYVNLEFDLESGKRGKRSAHVAEQLRYLTGAESVAIVNNNAAAVLLTLCTLSTGRETIVSRGELIEIGGSFRMPDIMEASGAIMVEVGTTNRTYLSDYENEITGNTAVLFKAHRSNFNIEGFTEEVDIKALARLANAHNLISNYDLGSGLLRRLPDLGTGKEPDVQSVIADGADIVTFSCDKLLGGPQAGIIAGKSHLVDLVAKAPLMRALRVDKTTLALLSIVLSRLIGDKKRLVDIPVYEMLQRSTEQLQSLAADLSSGLSAAGIKNSIVETQGRVGGGSLPSLAIPSLSVKLSNPSRQAAAALHTRLMSSDVPVLAVLREGELYFDVLTLQSDELENIVAAVRGTS